MNYKSKKIWLTQERTKYTTVRIYNNHKDMISFYRKHTGVNDSILGASLHYELLCNNVLTKDVGIVLLSKENLSIGIVCHELMHAVLWAWKHKEFKKQHPIIIHSMNQEEYLLHNLTFAINQFYK